MTKKEEVYERSMQGLRSLQRAVREELEKKARLGQEAVVLRDGKPTRVPAAELIKDYENQPPP